MSSNNYDDGRQSDLAVMDAGEYKNKRRLRRILDAHDKVEDKEDEAMELYSFGEISDEGRNIMLLNAVQQFIREIYNLLMEHSEELDDGEINHYWHDPDRVIGTLRREHAEDVHFHGLRDVLMARELYWEQWTETVSGRHGPDRTETKAQSHTVPKDVSRAAFLLAKQFLSRERTIELEFEPDGLPTWGFIEVDEDEDVVDTADLARERHAKEKEEDDEDDE